MELKFGDLGKLRWYYQVLIVSAVCGGLLAGLLHLIFRSGISQLPGLEKPTGFLSQKTTVYRLGVELMTTFALPFEVASVILLAALAGAAYLSTGNSNRKI